MVHLTVRNGLTLAYIVAFTNAALSLVLAFGISLDGGQQTAIVGFVNAAVMLAARVLHMPESTPGGGTVAVRHVPVLETHPPASPPDTEPAVIVPPLPVRPLEPPK